MPKRSLKSSSETNGEFATISDSKDLSDAKMTNGDGGQHVNGSTLPKKSDSRKSNVTAENTIKHLDDFYQRVFSTIEKLRQDLDANQLPPSDLFNNIWLMNEVCIPIALPANQMLCGNFKIKYGAPEFIPLCWQIARQSSKQAPKARTITTESIDSASSIKLPLSNVSLNVPHNVPEKSTNESTPDAEIDIITKHKLTDNNCDVKYPDDLSELDIEPEKSEPSDGSIRFVTTTMGKPTIHSLFAVNQLGKISHPIVIFPKRSDMETESQNDMLLQRICYDQTPAGLLNNIDLFLDWLPQFARQFRRPFVDPDVDSSQSASELKLPYIVLLLSDNFKNFFVKNSSVESRKRFIRLCRANRMLIFFYPSPVNRKDFLFKNIVEKFKMTWRPTLLQFATNNKFNVNSKTGFIYTLVESLRRMYDPSFIVSMCSHHIYGLGSNVPSNYVYPEKFQDFSESFKELGGAHEWLKQLFTSHPISTELGNAYTTNLTMIEQSYATSLAQYQSGTDSDSEKNKPTVVSESTDENVDDDTSQSHSVSQSAPKIVYTKFTEDEIESLCEWIDEMSMIGCLCIKYTFLRDLYNKGRLDNKSGVKESLAIEKRWFELVNKNQDKFKYKLSSGFNENEHMVRWFDMDYWRVCYQKYLKKCQIASAEQVWTFEILHFPYQNANGITRAPEKDYQQRPRNLKPRISVIFAYSASGDYLPPYFVYPTDFNQVKARKSLRPGEISTDMAATNGEPMVSSSSIESNLDATLTSLESDNLNESIEVYARNGYVTSRIFEKWLTNSFLPYFNQKNAKSPSDQPPTSESKQNEENNVDMRDAGTNDQIEVENQATSTIESKPSSSEPNKLLLYCGKLAVIDVINLQLCKENNICLFAITDENTIPFNYLFVKSLRKRQTDLFLESWRKVTPRLNLNNQLKSNSRQIFYSVFMDAFQNCIEEIDSTNDSQPALNADNTNSMASQLLDPSISTVASSQASTSSSAIASFRTKMASTFEQCELWPINETAYKKYQENLNEKVKQTEAKAN